MTSIFINLMSVILGVSWASLFYVLWLEYSLGRLHTAPAG